MLLFYQQKQKPKWNFKECQDNMLHPAINCFRFKTSKFNSKYSPLQLLNTTMQRVESEFCNLNRKLPRGTVEKKMSDLTSISIHPYLLQ